MKYVMAEMFGFKYYMSFNIVCFYWSNRKTSQLVWGDW